MKNFDKLKLRIFSTFELGILNIFGIIFLLVPPRNAVPIGLYDSS